MELFNLRLIYSFLMASLVALRCYTLDTSREIFFTISGHLSRGQINDHLNYLVHLGKFIDQRNFLNPLSPACELGNLHLLQLPVGLRFLVKLAPGV